MEIFGIAAKQIVGIVFLAGVIATIIAVTTPDYSGLTRHVWNVPSDRDRLEIIAAHPGAWRWSSAWWAIGGIFRFGLVALLLRQNNEALIGEIAVVCFILAVLLWLVAMAYRMGVEPLVIAATEGLIHFQPGSNLSRRGA